MTKCNKNLILVGGGGFALEIYTYILEEISNQILTDLTIKGVLDKSSNCEVLEKHPELQYLGDIDEYVREDRDVALIAVGNAIVRRNIAQKLKVICLPLYTYVHSSAYLSSAAKVGGGVFIAPHCIVSAHSRIYDNVALNVYCGVGHGATIGQCSIMSPYSVINGDCELGEAVFLGSRVTLNPKIKVGSFSLIDAGCILREDISELSIVSQRAEQTVFDNRILRRQLNL